MALIVGIVFLVNGAGMVANMPHHYQKTTAVITRVSGGGSGGITTYRYEAGGKEYSVTNNEYSSLTYRGKEVTVYYTPENPKDIYLWNDIALPFFICAVGLTTSVIAAIFLKRVIALWQTS